MIRSALLLVALSSSLLLAACGKENPPAASKPAASVAAKPATSSLVKAAGVADKGWLAKAVADYPLKTCVVSGDEFGGSMGPALDYIFKQVGQPDRLVRFCCADCPDKFEKEPAKFLAMIDAAVAKMKK